MRPWYNHPLTDIVLGITAFGVGCFSGYYAFAPLHDAITLSLASSPLPLPSKTFPFDPLVPCQIVMALFGGGVLCYFVLRPRVGPLTSLLAAVFFGYQTMFSISLGQFFVPKPGVIFFLSHFGFVFVCPAIFGAVATADFLWSLLIRKQPFIFRRG